MTNIVARPPMPSLRKAGKLIGRDRRAHPANWIGAAPGMRRGYSPITTASHCGTAVPFSR